MKFPLFTRRSIPLFLACCCLSCHSLKNLDSATTGEQEKHYADYDQGSLHPVSLPVLMPYNRIIRPAGKAVSYGDPNLENHSLDLQPIPGSDLVAIEDRYGIAILDPGSRRIISRWSYADEEAYHGYMSTYSGIQVIKDGQGVSIFWSAAHGVDPTSKVFQARLKGRSLNVVRTFDFVPKGDSPLALPNELAITLENGNQYLYVVLNGNNSLEKIEVSTGKTLWSAPTGVAPYGIFIQGEKAFVTNWAGTMPSAGNPAETAGVPYGKAYIDPATGAINNGSVSVYSISDGKLINSIPVGLHPNDIVGHPAGEVLCVSNGNSDTVSVIDIETLAVVETISVKIHDAGTGFIGDSPNALAFNEDGSRLYVANGMDNALAVVQFSPENQKSMVMGYIPTEAYPGGISLKDDTLFVANLEGEGARVNSLQMEHPEEITEQISKGAFNAHHQKATVSMIPVPDEKKLAAYTERVKEQMLHFRLELAKLAPRPNQPPRPMPERIGEPSVFKHVIYIIKENRTYDQVLGDIPSGNGEKDLCIFGEQVTPNQHQLARDFLLLDNYYASGKCSAEGHQWTDAAIVTDYIEKNVRAWFRSYPHVQNDALVYDQKGFLWNNAADHGKTVRIYGEACEPNIDPNLSWTDIYHGYKAGKPLDFHNTTTISRVEPMLSDTFPGSDQLKITEQIRADAFIEELQAYEKMPGDQLPELCVMALALDHTTGTRPGMPTPRAMVADNDLALGRIIEAVSNSRFWKNTVIFVTEDDSQEGWDHVSAYRTTGFVISPYSRLQKSISTNYNQTSVVRSIEQILGIPPMNLMDATALPMFNCFGESYSEKGYKSSPNQIALDEMNPELEELSGKGLSFAKKSLRPEYDHIDSGSDDLLNRILWFSSKGKEPYPAKLAGTDDGEDDE